MWFKNLRIYKLTEPLSLVGQELDITLMEHGFSPCGSIDIMRYGFWPVIGDCHPFTHSALWFTMICAKKEEKILPSSVINDQLEEKSKAMSESEGRHIGRKEKQTLKDEIIFSLLPKAFTKSSLDYAYIDHKGGFIVVNSSSAKRAEDLLSALREALGSLKVIPISAKNIPTQVMTHWLQTGDAPHQFELGDECELQGGKDGRVIRCKRQDLTADEIRAHLSSGMFVSKIALRWKESIHCVIDDQIAVKKLKFDDLIQDKANDRNPESKAEQFDADFEIMTGELKQFIAALLSAFGGESEELA